MTMILTFKLRNCHGMEDEILKTFSVSILEITFYFIKKKTNEVIGSFKLQTTVGFPK